MWEFFDQGTVSAKKKARCKIDDYPKPIIQAQATPNWTQNLDAHYKQHEPYADLVEGKAHASVGKAPAREQGMLQLLNRGEGEIHLRLILGFIVGGHMRVSAVEEQGYKDMMRGFTKKPSLNLPSRKTMAKLVTHTAIVARQRLREMVASETVCLTCDGCTSGNGLSMMGVAAHWVNQDRELISACLYVFELPGSHDSAR